MTDAITIRIAGTPVPKGRPRMTKAGFAFTPKKTRKWEDDARVMARQKMEGRSQIDGPVKVLVVAQYEPPASWPAWKRLAAIGGHIAHTSRPDLDNLEKAVCDACNEIVYRDDSQIVEKVSRKRYGNHSYVEIIIQPTGQVSPAAKKSDLEAAA